MANNLSSVFDIRHATIRQKASLAADGRAGGQLERGEEARDAHLARNSMSHASSEGLAKRRKKAEAPRSCAMPLSLSPHARFVRQRSGGGS